MAEDPATGNPTVDACAPAASARSVAEQLVAVLEGCHVLAPSVVSLDAALGLVLAEDVVSATDTPPFDNSAMDGYAVRRADLLLASAANPIVLPVIADLAAGTAENPWIDPGETARIMTGAPLPDGADAIVPIEDTDQGTERVTVTRAPAPHAHIRRAGEDAHAGDTVLRAGCVLWPTRVAAAASAGTSMLLAHPAPRVAVISTGSELVTPGDPTRRGQIPDSNSYLLAAAVAEAGCTPIRVGAVPDDERTLRELLASLADTVDAIVLSGGVSVGAYDVVKAVLAPLGTVRFGPVKMQPGKPQGFGRWPSPEPQDSADEGEFPRLPALADTPASDLPGAAGSNDEASAPQATGDGMPAPFGPVIFALPGNPVSAYVSFEVFVRPGLRRMQGHTDLHRPTVVATVTDGWRSPAGRAQYMPVIVEHDGDRTVVRRAAAGGSGSHLVAGLGQSNGLAMVAEDTTQISGGDLVTVMLTS
ncbi:gephyrin-like molybdotransferase Glp [Cryobacterium roopkundense]|uniref:Molybdopterin molybdenumtransferase n=1 Tax=Cryobacterium roopkundense TaxID=1001240 RepID=A0A7W9E4W8_9MICO|nr:gephyrin-like molybdotransferase Glp [Cryobacterium roopkundense]MBB5642561.1 molybdopterin molybdotransferase [Cryobacterium roopkundense]